MEKPRPGGDSSWMLQAPSSFTFLPHVSSTTTYLIPHDSTRPCGLPSWTLVHSQPDFRFLHHLTHGPLELRGRDLCYQGVDSRCRLLYFFSPCGVIFLASLLFSFPPSHNVKGLYSCIHANPWPFVRVFRTSDVQSVSRVHLSSGPTIRPI